MARRTSAIVIGALFALLLIVVVFSTVQSGTAALSFPFLTKKETAQERLLRLAQEAKRHIRITDPSPFIGEVKNVEFLRTQYAFYNNARDGDLLIMTKDRAILYRPEDDILIDVLSRSEAYATGARAGVPAPTVPPMPTVPRPAGTSASVRSSSSSVWRLQPAAQNQARSASSRGWVLTPSSRAGGEQ